MPYYTSSEAQQIAKGQVEVARAIEDRWQHLASSLRGFFTRLFRGTQPGSHF